MYWQIGHLIVEDEQHGNSKATYGKAILKNLAKQLTLEFGKGFDERNLNNIRAFYNTFPIWNAVRTELSWTHYRIISRLETQELRHHTSDFFIDLVFYNYYLKCFVWIDLKTNVKVMRN